MDDRELLQKNPLAWRILRHTRLYGPDTPAIIGKRLLGKRSGHTVDEFRQAYEELLSRDLVERVPGKELDRNDLTSSIKKTLKRRAKYATPRKTHTYYRLSRKGELLLRGLEREGFDPLP